MFDGLRVPGHTSFSPARIGPFVRIAAGSNSTNEDAFMSQHRQRDSRPTPGADSAERRTARTGRRAAGSAVVVGGAALLAACVVSACGDDGTSKFKVGPGSSSSSSGGTLIIDDGDGGGSTSITLPDGAVIQVPGTSGSCDGGTAGGCCPGGSSTTISGKVLDPAGINALYNVAVYIKDPNAPLPDLSKVGITCGCSALFPSDVLGMATTDANGAFTIATERAIGSNTTLVVQTGKWRMEYSNLNFTACGANQAPPLRLPRNSQEGNLPEIAISTGGADSLECLPLRIGVSASEYVAGAATGGHIHVYQGYNGANTSPAAPESVSALYNSVTNLKTNDVVLFSCEGHETTGGKPGQPMTAAFQQNVMDYANMGGRVFASHYHYKFFNSGPFNTAPGPVAQWQGTDNANEAIDDKASFPVDVDTTLSNGSAFPEGSALQTWLGNANALINGKLDVFQARVNVVTLNQPTAVEWIHLDPSVTASSVDAKSNPGTTFVPSATQYFSVDLPFGASAEAVCGRVVYSDLHVSGGPNHDPPAPFNIAKYEPADYSTTGTVPAGCAMHALLPQEAALEFMLFDLSSCLVPIGSTTPPLNLPPPK
jgi:hypothetical protein